MLFFYTLSHFDHILLTYYSLFEAVSFFPGVKRLRAFFRFSPCPLSAIPPLPGAEVRAVSNYTDDPRSAWRIGESAEKLAETIIRILSDYE